MKKMFIVLFLAMVLGNAFGNSGSFHVPFSDNRLMDTSGGQSDIALVIPVDTESPSVPSGLVATNITGTSFDLTWDASTDNVGVFGYEVFQNGGWIGANTVPSLHITGLTAGTTYNFTVDAFDTATPKANISAPSTALSVTTSGIIVPPTPDTEAPSIPIGLVASNITETSFDLTWDASTDNVGVFGYEVFQNGGWIGANTVPSLHITGLTAGTTYNFTVDAFDTATPKANISAPSTALSVTTSGIIVPPTKDTQAPTVPTGLVASNITGTSFELSWDASTDNVGIAFYELYINGAWAGGVTETSKVFIGLTGNTAYSMSLRAYDAAMNPSAESAKLVVTTLGASDTESPSVPSGLVATNVTETSFDLAWTASTDNVGVFGYQVYKDGVQVGANTVPTLHITGLTAGTSYNFTVDAFDTATPKANISVPSAALSVTTSAIIVPPTPDTEAPSVPTGLVASNVTETSFDLAWDVSTDNVGVFGYEVFQNGAWIGANTVPTLHITGLTAGTSYNFTVDAFDTATPKANMSAPSAALSVTTSGIIVPPTPDTEAPSIPTGLVASNITETSFDLAWTASTDNVGVFGYEVFQNGGFIGANTVPLLHITGLTAGTSYNFTVDAFDTATPKANLSAPSSPLSVTTSGIIVPPTPDTEAPSIPVGLVASNITETSFDLAWDASTDNVGVFGYEVFQNGGFIGANTVPSLHITGLTAGTSYNFTVDAFDTATPKANISAPSSPLSVTTSGIIVPPTPDTEAPSVPTGLVASNITETSFDLAWDASTDNVGVFGYEVFQNGVWIGANTVPSLHITGLAAGTSYNFRVDAFDTATPKANISAPSTALKVTTDGTPVIVVPDTQAPSIPSGLVASNITETSFDLSWNASTDNVAVFGYEVYNTSFVWIGATTTTSLSITGLTKGTTYKFTVDAFDTATPANLSKASAVFTVTTSGVAGASEVPTVPTGLVASNVTKSSFTLSWAASTDNIGVHGYEVYQDGVYFGATTGLSMDITGLECGSSYAFTVDAFDSETPANISNQSAVLLVGTVDCLSSAPGISSSEISIFPNPVASVLTIKNLPENTILTIFTVEGKLVDKVATLGENSAIFNVSNWDRGIYFIHVQSGRNLEVKKVIVE